MHRASAELERVVAALPVDAWTAPTPCDITVREVVDHVVAGNLFAVRLLAGATADGARAGLDDDHLGGDPAGAVRSSCAGQVAAFEAADPGRALHHPIGEISLETFLRFRLGELVVHGWDLTVGAGLDARIDDELAAGLWSMVEPHVEEMRTMGAFGDGASAALPRDATAQARLLDAFGRRTG